MNYSEFANRLNLWAARHSFAVWNRLRTIPLCEVGLKHVGLVGGKAVNLGRLLNAKLPVPSGFVIPVRAFEAFVRAETEWNSVLAMLDGLDGENLAEVESVSRQIEQQLARIPVPGELAKAVKRAMDQIPGCRLWAVRSSATVEDLPDASYAGQHDSYLNVPPGEILEKVRCCWVSLFNPRAIAYRARKKISHRGAAMAVIVQQMIPAERAGVLFTADPASGDAYRIVIESAAGLGDNVVSGHAAVERLVLRRPFYQILERSAVDSAGSLGNNTARALARLSREVEELFGTPQDIEWAIRDGQIHLLQARPITTKLKEKTWEERQVWANLNTGEVVPDVMSPITWSMFNSLFDGILHNVFLMVGADTHRAAPIGLVAGRIYFNANTGVAAVKPFSWLLKRLPNVAEALGGGNIEEYREEGSIPAEDLPNLGFSWPKYILSWPGLLWKLIRHSPRRGDAWMRILKARVDELSRINLEKMSTAELTKYFALLLCEEFKGWDLIFLGTQGAALPVFQKACHDWLGDRDLRLGYRLFAGLGGVPEAEAGLALWRLALLARADPETKTLICSGKAWGEIDTRLGETEPGRRFLNAWSGFMTEHGHHCRGELELFNARWSETPDYILGLVRSYVQSSEWVDPLKKQQHLARQREELTEQCRQRLPNPFKRWIFSRALWRAQKLSRNREEWKNQAVRLVALLRGVLLSLGPRLQQQGVLDCVEDVFFLEVSELGLAVSGKTPFAVKERIAARRKEYEFNCSFSPPPVVFGKFKPEAVPPGQPNGKVLKGIPVSPGKVVGRAKVILRSDDHAQVLPGEILVAPFADPAWTPYFLTAAAVVTDQGGILSHGSIVAREYGLPAVTNLGCAIGTIQTGDEIEVDGNVGRVTILS